MAGKSLFGRDEDDTRPAGDDEPAATGKRGRSAKPGSTKPVDPRPEKRQEGVRLIAKTEAAKVAEQPQVAKRRGDDLPRYGDRPPGGLSTPPAKAPSLRFPLSNADTPSPAGRPRPTVDAGPPPASQVALGPPSAEGAPDDPPLFDWDEEEDEVEKLTVEPPTGETVLPHWTEPPTGEVPRVVTVANPEAGESEGDDEDWSSYTSGVRWRDEHDTWDDSGVMDDLVEDAIEAEGPRLGALDTEARPTQEEYLTFDDLDVPEQEPPSVRPGTVRRDGRTSPAPEAPRRPSVAADRANQEPVADGSPPPAARRRSPLPSLPSPARRRPAEGEPVGGSERNIPLAIGVGVGIGVVALLIFRLGGPVPAMLLATGVIVMAGAEFLSAVRDAGFRPVIPLGLAAMVGLPLAAWFRGEPGIPLVLFLFVAFSVLWYLLGITRARAVRNLGVTTLAVVWIGMFGAYASLLLKIGRVPLASGGFTEVDQGVSIVILAVLASIGYDVGGLAVGRRFGRTPFSSASPNKTLEGLLGGCIAAVALVVVFGGLLHVGPFSLLQALVFGVLCAIAAPIGDLGESLLKRDLDIKDMGNVIPGHGGVLDRFDNLLFVLPTAYYATRILLELTPYVG